MHIYKAKKRLANAKMGPPRDLAILTASPENATDVPVVLELPVSGFEDAVGPAEPIPEPEPVPVG